MNEKYLLIIIGAIAICYGLVSSLRLRRSKSWAPVTGRITRSRKELRHTDSGKLEVADIAYEYTFGDKTHSSTIIKIGGDMLSIPSKQKVTETDGLLLKYPVNAIVTVYVDPAYPKVACLERSGAEAVFISIFFGVLAVVVGLYLWK